MRTLNHLYQKRVGLLGTIFGGLLLSIPAISQAVIAQQPTSKVNPCPSISTKNHITVEFWFRKVPTKYCNFQTE
jgi:hypothetical protein